MYTSLIGIYVSTVMYGSTNVYRYFFSFCFLILQQLDTSVHTYLGTDRVVTDNPEEAAAYPMEFLNAQTPSGLPKHKLELKVYTFHLFRISLHISAFLLLSMLFRINYLISFNMLKTYILWYLIKKMEGRLYFHLF